MSTDNLPTFGAPDPTFALAPLRQALEHLTALEDLLDGVRFNDPSHDYRAGACVADLRTLLVVELRVHEKVALARQAK